MLNFRKTLLTAAFLTATAGPAAAEIIPLDDSAWYLGFDAGATYVPERGATFSGTSADVEFDTGYAFSGEVGYSFGPSLRAGLELGWRGNDVDSVEGGIADEGSLNAVSLMGNFTFDVPTDTAFVPYVGGGVGGAWLDADDLGGLVSDRDVVLAYQARAGVRYALSPNASLNLGYRYFGTEEASFDEGGQSVDMDYGSHSIMLGLTFRLGPQAEPPKPIAAKAPAPQPKAEPAPPPEPEPAPDASMRATPATFLVFFDWNRSDIKSDARPVIERAAEHYLDGGYSIVEVVGHADRSGPRDYNLALSRRRAENVRDVLVQEGVPEDEITITARGEDDPLVPTPDGVREPRNRRVEIIIP